MVVSVAIFLGLLVFVFICLRVEEADRDGGNVVVAGIVMGIVCIATIQAGSALVTFYSSKDSDGWAPSATVAEEEFGFMSGETYPFELEGYTGESAGFFNANVIEASSTLSIDFMSADGHSYTFEVPIENVESAQDETANPTVTLYLSEVRGGYARMTIVEQKPCSWGFNFVFLVCQRSDAEREYQIEDSVREPLSLSEVVNNGVQGAKMTLTPEMYEELFGK